MKLKSCIIGLGQVGLKFDLHEERKRNRSDIATHFSAYEKLSEKYEIVAAVDPDESSWQHALERNPAICCFRDIKDLLASGLKIDVVSICSPDRFHLPNLEAIWPHVRGILLEKPVSTMEDTDKSVALIEQIIAAKKPIYVNYAKRPEIALAKAVEHIRANGERIKFVECRYSGPFLAVGSHATDLLNFITSVSSIKAVLRHPHAEGEGFSAMMVGENNSLVNLSYTGPRHELIFEVDIATNKSRYQILDNFLKYVRSELTPSNRYKNYFEYTAQETLEFGPNLTRIATFLDDLHLDVTSERPRTENIRKSVETQLLMKAISSSV